LDIDEAVVVSVRLVEQLADVGFPFLAGVDTAALPVAPHRGPREIGIVAARTAFGRARFSAISLLGADACCRKQEKKYADGVAHHGLTSIRLDASERPRSSTERRLSSARRLDLILVKNSN
jgi:hypothetical protein